MIRLARKLSDEWREATGLSQRPRRQHSDSILRYLVVASLALTSFSCSSGDHDRDSRLDTDSAARQKEYWHSYEPKIEKLIGVLDTMTFLGPPGFGETPLIDRRFNLYVLRLEEPINIQADLDDELNADTLTNITLLQIRLQGIMDVRSYLGQKVTIVGSLSRATAGGEFTEAILRLICIQSFYVDI